MAAILVPAGFGRLSPLTPLSPRYVRSGPLIRRSGPTGLSRNEMVINTGQNAWTINAGLLRQEWPQMYRQLRATGSRAIRLNDISLSEYRSVEDMWGTSDAWDNIMSIIAFSGGARPFYPTTPPPLYQLYLAIQQNWFDPPTQAEIMQHMLPLLDQMCAVLDRSPGLQIPCCVTSLVAQLGLRLASTAAQLDFELLWGLISCVDRICGKNDNLLEALICGLDGNDRLDLLAFSTAYARPPALGGIGTGDTLAIRIGAIYYGIRDVDFATLNGY